MTQLNRSIERWRGCDPAYMATEQSPAAITYAFVDAQHDILALSEMNAELLDACEAARFMLRSIGRHEDGIYAALERAIGRAAT